jgi:hypothetical protein
MSQRSQVMYQATRRAPTRSDVGGAARRGRAAWLRCVSVVALWALWSVSAGCDGDAQGELGGDATASDTGVGDTGVGDTGATTQGDTSKVTDSTAPDGDEGDSADDADGADGVLNPNALQITFDPQGQGFWRTPWPTDARLTAAGTPDLSDFPDVQAQPLLGAYRDEIERNVKGFAMMPVVYVPLDRPLEAASLPQLSDTLAATSTLQLMDLSEDGCGERVPLEVQFNVEADRFLSANTVQAAPAIGHVLKANRTYGLLLLRSFGGEQGLTTARPAGFEEALADEAGATAEGRALGPLRRCLPQADVSLDDVAFATVFTTQDPLDEVRRLHAAVVDPQRVEVRPVIDWHRSEAWSRPLDIVTYEATVMMPVFQDGQTPYDSAGGALVFDAQGEPVIQRWEEVPMAITWRDPVGDVALPILVFIDGTGWSRWSNLTSTWTRDALSRGYAVASFMPQFHGGRAGFTGDTDVSTFNFFNPPAGRSNFRQQAAETAYFVRVLREQVAAQVAGSPDAPSLDLSHIVYGGHSQGALVGALTAAIDSQFSAYVLNGLSAYLSLTIIGRKDLADYEAIIRSTFRIGRPLDRFYPLIQVVQLGAEVVDTHNYVGAWKGWPAHPRGNSVFVINGRNDTTTVQRAIDHLTMTADIAPIAPPGWDVDSDQTSALASEPLPIEGNRTSTSSDTLTHATLLDAGTGHFTIYQRRAARDLSLAFWDSSAPATPGGPPSLPVLSMYRESFCADGLDDDGDGLIDCADPQCASFNNCVETACADNMDNNDNGLADCADPNCAATDACAERTCDDEMDNDSDGFTDCADPNCAGAQACEEVLCADSLDNDNNGLTDCDDLACMRTDACPLPRETSCADGLDDDSDGLTDCADLDCAFASVACPAPTPTCADGDLGGALGARLLSSSIEGFTDRFPPPSCAPLNEGLDTPDLSALWTAPAAGRYAFSTAGTRFDTILTLLSPSCDPSAPLACDDDGLNHRLSYLERDLAAGEAVVIVVSPYDAATRGVVNLSITALP